MVWLLAALGLVVLGLIFAFVNPIGGGGLFRPTGQYQELSQIEVNTGSDGKKTFGGARSEKRGGLYVIWLSGTPYQMGFQHGKLLKEEILKGALDYHADPVHQHQPMASMKPARQWLMERFLTWSIYFPLRLGAPRDFLEELKGLSDGSDIPFTKVFRGNMLSEFNMAGMKIQRRLFLKRLGKHDECTSFAAFGSQTADGRLVVGRNTDYSGASLWDVTQTVFFYKPQQDYPYANVGSAGLIKCNSCMNEKGLVLGGHFMYSTDVNPHGAGFTALQHEIMRKTSTITEAYQILKNNRRAGAFGYLIASQRDQNAAVLEATSSRLGIRYAEKDVVFETNFLTTPECRPVDMIHRLGITKNSVSRFLRMEELIREHGGRITIQEAASFMGDHKDMASGDTRPFGNVIATLANLTSVVFSPADLRFWAADGPAPVCNNPYIGFDMQAEFNGTAYTIEPSVLKPNTYCETVSFTALRNYYPVYVKAFLPPFDKNGLPECVEQILQECPDGVCHHMQRIKLLLQKGKAQEALACLQSLKNSTALSPSELAQVHLLTGMAHDELGKRTTALECYQHILHMPQPDSKQELSAINPFILADARVFIGRAARLADLRAVEASLEMSSLYDR